MLLIKNFTKTKIDKNFLQKVAGKTLDNLPKYKKSNKKIEIELVVIGEKRMKSLNRDWRGKDKATDVLSFENQKPLLCQGYGGQAKIKFIIPPNKIINLGQIFICYPVAKRQAMRYGASMQEEIAKLLVHGILHLAGYNHEKNAKEEKTMMDLQEKILCKIKKNKK